MALPVHSLKQASCRVCPHASITAILSSSLGVVDLAVPLSCSCGGGGGVAAAAGVDWASPVGSVVCVPEWWEREWEEPSKGRASGPEQEAVEEELDAAAAVGSCCKADGSTSRFSRQTMH